MNHVKYQSFGFQIIYYVGIIKEDGIFIMIQLIGAQNMMVEHSLHPPPSFLKEGGGGE